MSSTNSTTEISSGENRTRKARDETMHAVVAEPVDGGDDNVGRINVQNHSSGGTVYTITVEADGTVERCTCPDWRHNLSDDEICKHGRFIAAHDSILIAATGDMSVGTDCECSERTDFPCWSCYVSGRKDLPSE